MFWNSQPDRIRAATWSGNCREGKSEGAGKMVRQVFEDGRKLVVVFTGTMRAGREDGRGFITFPDGRKLVCEWRNGELIGTCKG